MATVIDKKTSIDWDIPTTRRKFPWEKWTDGQVWQVVEGEDFTSSVSTLKVQLKARAEKLGVEVRTHIEKSGDVPTVVFFQFVKS